MFIEYCKLGSLSTFLDRKEQGLSDSQVIFLMKEITKPLRKLHENKISHRDIKPDNIFITEFGQIKLADLGLAKLFKKGDLAHTVCGTK